ncbi:MAG: NAD(P)/FAD-dependent oxidoreductase [Verrucomicrobiales bacterium]
MTWDLITIGGGAAGFFGAITHAENGGGPTLILEKTANLLGKVKISGGGRCNVTHACPDPKELSKNYPRGERSLIGPLHRWGVEDTIDWFTSRGVELKTEADGRMFPSTDSSQTIIDCLTRAAHQAGVDIRTRCGVKSITPGDGFELETEAGETLQARNILLATGGTRLAAGARLAQQLGHTLEPAVPSLFTFKIRDPRLDGLSGISVAETVCKVVGSKLESSGPLLITHWGVSGPGILRLSAWGARELAATDYRFTLRVNWLPEIDVANELKRLRESSGKKQVGARSPFAEIPKRLWGQLVGGAGISKEQTWARLTKLERASLEDQLIRSEFTVDGKSLNKEEFVTCGGVKLHDINLQTMESKLCPGLFFAGEVIDVDGITGGFNFQNAWTSGRIAGLAIAGSPLH